MIRKALGLFVAFAFVVSFTAPLCAAAAPGPSHACCGGSAKKSPAGPAGSCCRQALPSSAKPAASTSAPVLSHSVPVVVSTVVVASPAPAARRVVSGAAPPGPTGLSPPARVV